MKTIKIEDSYDLGDYYSNVTKDGAWQKLINYLNSNKKLLNKLSFNKEASTILLQSLEPDNLLSIINKVDPSVYFQKNLIRTIKLNLKFNKETKQLEIDNSLNNINDINAISYNASYENKLKNDIYFSEDSVLINYENLSSEDINNFEYVLSILFFNKKKFSKNENEELKLENESFEYILLIYNRKNNKLEFINFNELNKENTLFNLSDFIIKYNNNENIEEENFNIDDGTFYYKFSNFKLAKTIILLSEPSENAILFFKNSLNKYIFDNFINLQYERNSEDII